MMPARDCGCRYSGGVFAGFDFLSFSSQMAGKIPSAAGRRCRLHTIKRGFCGAEKTASFGCHRGVHDGSFAFPTTSYTSAKTSGSIGSRRWSCA